MTSNPAAESTRALRTSDDPLWARLRQLLTERGFSPYEVALATFFPDDTAMEFGVLVTPDHHVYEFELRYGARGDLRQQIAAAYLWAWTDRTDHWRDRPFSDAVETALQLLDVEGQ